MKETVRTGHLVYIIIIAVIVNAFFLVIAFGGTDEAGKVMGTASTVSSLILSVIAIVLSLIDVAGQRQSIVDLRETAEKLQESNESANGLVEELTLKMTELQDMKDQMVESLKESAEWRNEILEAMKSLTEKDEVKPEDLEAIIKKANENSPTVTWREFLEQQSNLKKTRNSSHVIPGLGLAGLAGREYTSLPTNEKVIWTIKNRFDWLRESERPYDLIYEVIKSRFNLSPGETRDALEELKENNYIETFEKREGETWVRLTAKGKSS